MQHISAPQHPRLAARAKARAAAEAAAKTSANSVVALRAEVVRLAGVLETVLDDLESSSSPV